MKPKFEQGATLAVKWYNPYTSPPNGLPKIICKDKIIWANRDYDAYSDPFNSLAEWYRDIGITGYAAFVVFDAPPYKKMSPENLWKRRVGAARKKTMLKFPLFFDEAFKDEIERLVKLKRLPKSWFLYDKSN